MKWIKLQKGITVEGFGTLYGAVEPSREFPGCVVVLNGAGRDSGRDPKKLQTRRLLLPLSSVAWMTP